MKIAFSTLCCPHWLWEEAVTTAKDLGFDGIEVRGVQNEMYAPKARPFRPENLGDTMAWLARLGLDLPCLTTQSYLFDKERVHVHLAEAREYVDLAGKLGTPFVRVLGDSSPEPRDVDPGFVAENLAILARHCQGKGVKVLLETNGYFADSGRLAKLLGEVNSPHVGVLWDVHHPFRFFGEAPAKTYGNLKDYIAYLHVKDSVLENGQVKYRMLGNGDVPVREALLLLKKDDFQGYVSLEWVKRWCMELEDPDVALSHFLYFMKNLLS